MTVFFDPRISAASADPLYIEFEVQSSRKWMLIGVADGEIERGKTVQGMSEERQQSAVRFVSYSNSVWIDRITCKSSEEQLHVTYLWFDVS